MCGLVGLLVKKPALYDSLGALMVPMLIGMTERGPESAGLAVFTNGAKKGELKYNLWANTTDFNYWVGLENDFNQHLGSKVRLSTKGNHAILISHLEPQVVKTWVGEHFPGVHILSIGHNLDVYKDIGTPAEVAERYDFAKLKGSHLIGHTRMATESAVTPAHAHPFTAGIDFCLAHNGTISNPFSIRRKLEHFGIHFDTDNDTEAACRFIEWCMRSGDDLEAAIKKCFEELDGFYTFLMGTRNKLALVRDPFACKPAVVAETDDYVAIASEFRSLAQLPDIKNASLFEPVPERLYVWTVEGKA
jgi:glutamate synthase domain-containing protein 1